MSKQIVIFTTRKRKIEVSIDASKLPKHITRRRFAETTVDQHIKIVTVKNESFNKSYNENPLLLSQHKILPHLPPINHQQTNLINRS